MNTTCKYKETCAGCCLECEDYMETSLEEAHKYYEEMKTKRFEVLHD